jgi:hypothetical protein
MYFISSPLQRSIMPESASHPDGVTNYTLEEGG